jgi:histone-lysine N-methyltransferase SETD1
MSQTGGVPAVRRSVSPGSLKRKRGLTDYTKSQRARLAEGASSSTSSRLSATSSLHKQYPSPDSDEPRRSETGDILHGANSTSSLNSAASSVFSQGSQSASQNRAASLANGLTPLTNHSDSSPAKTSSPRAAHISVEMSTTNGTHAFSDVRSSNMEESSSNSHAFGDRPSMQLPPGKVKGYRAVWDPELDGRLKREERKRAQIRTKDFGLEVRNIFHNSLSLRNMIQVT